MHIGISGVKEEILVYWFILKPAFGIASFIATWIYRSQLAIQGNWTGISTGNNNTQFFFEEVKNKHGTTRIRIGITGIPKNRFTFKREGAVDKLSKWMLFSTEPQANDSKFDDKVYIASDNNLLVSKLRQDEKARDVIQRILYLSNSGIKKSTFIKNSPHRLWVEYKTEGSLGGQSPKVLTQKIAPLLQILREHLVEDLAARESAVDIKNALISNILSLIPNALFISALFYFFEVSFTRSQESDYFYPFIPSLIIGLFVCIVFTAICKFLLSDSSRAHIPVVEFVLLGYLSIILITFAGYHSANQDLDTVSPRIHSSIIHDKKINRGRRSTSYYFHVQENLGGDFRSEKKLKVSNRLFNQIEIGEQIDIAIKPGYLGHEWIQDISRSME